MASILEFSLAHALEEVQVFFDSSFPKRAVASRFGEGSPVFTDLIRTQAVDIGLASTDQDTGEFVECLKIIGGMGQSFPPVETEPADVFQNRFCVGRIFLDRVGVIETHEAMPTKIAGHAEIEKNRLCMADVQITVWLRRKTGEHFFMFSRLQVRFDDFANEMSCRR